MSHVKITIEKKKKRENNEKDRVKKKSFTTNAWMSTKIDKIDDYCLCINILLWRIISSQTLLPPQKMTKDGYFQLLMSLLPYTKANKLMQKWDIRSWYERTWASIELLRIIQAQERKGSLAHRQKTSNYPRTKHTLVYSMPAKKKNGVRSTPMEVNLF